MRGRKPKPTAQRVLEGNPGKRGINHDEPQLPATPAEVLQVPTELAGDEIATREWNRLAPKLYQAKQITDGDRSVFLLYCQEVSRAQRAQVKLIEHDDVVLGSKGGPVKNPYYPIRKASVLAVQRLAAELGLTPSSRARVTRENDDDDFGAADPFDKFDEHPRTH
jgi:P27 family predicted phage terminase small subunit